MIIFELDCNRHIPIGRSIRGSFQTDEFGSDFVDVCNFIFLERLVSGSIDRLEVDCTVRAHRYTVRVILPFAIVDFVLLGCQFNIISKTRCNPDICPGCGGNVCGNIGNSRSNLVNPVNNNFLCGNISCIICSTEDNYPVFRECDAFSDNPVFSIKCVSDSLNSACVVFRRSRKCYIFIRPHVCISGDCQNWSNIILIQQIKTVHIKNNRCNSLNFVIMTAIKICPIPCHPAICSYRVIKDDFSGCFVVTIGKNHVTGSIGGDERN